MTYEEFWHPLQTLYETGEAKAIARTVLEVCFNLTMTDILCGKVTQLSANDQNKLKEILQFWRNIFPRRTWRTNSKT